MGLQFITKKDPSQHVYVKVLVELVQKNHELFIYIARIFTTYRKKEIPDTKQFRLFVKATFQHPRLSLTKKERHQLRELTDRIYQHPDFQLIRSEFLEEMTAYFGPFKMKSSSPKTFREPSIYENNYLIGKTGHKCDVVFFEHDYEPMELIECKSTLATFMTLTKDFEKARKNTRGKILYLNKVREYLMVHYVEPILSFSCYDTNVDLIKENIYNNWGFHHYLFLTPIKLCKRES